MNMKNYIDKIKNLDRKWIIIISIIIAVILVISSLILVVSFNISKYLNQNTFYNGISIENVDIGGLSKDEATTKLSEIEQNSIPNINIILKYEDKSFNVTSNDFTYNYNTSDVLQQAYNYGRYGNLLSRYNTVKSLQTTTKNFEIQATPNEESIKTKISEIASEIDKPASNGSIQFTPNEETIFKYSEQGLDGVSVNQDELLNLIKETLTTSTEENNEIQIPATITPHEGKSIEQLKEETQLISQFTTLSSGLYNPTSNMRLALQKVNGTILNPGEQFSFNQKVGNSTTAAGGWLPAAAISNGEYIQEYGGGICQASTTIYGAVVRAGLQIVERNPHGIPSSYVKIGQDAAVSYGGIDFKFKNNYDTPIYIRSYMSGYTLHVEIYGKKPTEWDNITVTSQTTQTITLPESVTQDNTLSNGQRVVISQGRTGYRATAQRHYYKNDVLIKSENLPSSYYPPKQATVKVGTKVDTPSQTPNPTPPQTPESSIPSTSTPESSTPSTSTPESSIPSTPESSTPSTSTPESSSSTPVTSG